MPDFHPVLKNYCPPESLLLCLRIIGHIAGDYHLKEFQCGQRINY